MLITGIQTKNMHHKISLYADNIVIFHQNPMILLQKTIKTINSFASISEYSIGINHQLALYNHKGVMQQPTLYLYHYAVITSPIWGEKPSETQDPRMIRSTKFQPEQSGKSS